MTTDEIRYSVLCCRDEFGLWLKIPEAGLQLCTEDLDVGLDLLEEHFDAVLEQRRTRGDVLPRNRVRTIRQVEKDEYGPTEVDLEQERYLRELAEEDEA